VKSIIHSPPKTSLEQGEVINYDVDLNIEVWEPADSNPGVSGAKSIFLLPLYQTLEVI